jgi:hypothetical protein
MFNKRKEVIPGVDANGFPIINTRPDNVWFAANVAFVFGKGAIFDDDDDRTFNTVLNAFINDFHGKGFLINQVLIEDYKESQTLQELEKKLHISNGNYHMCLIPVVLNGADLTQAPEPMFRKLGPINKFMQWSTIKDFISRCISAYAFVTDPKNNAPEPLHAEPEMFKFYDKIDQEAVNMNVQELMKQQPKPQLKQQLKQPQPKMNLWNQMRQDLDHGNQIPTTQGAVETQFNLNRMSNLDKSREYKIWDNYDESIGKNTTTPGLTMSVCMPTLNMKKVKVI